MSKNLKIDNISGFKNLNAISQKEMREACIYSYSQIPNIVIKQYSLLLEEEEQKIINRAKDLYKWIGKHLINWLYGERDPLINRCNKSKLYKPQALSFREYLFLIQEIWSHELFEKQLKIDTFEQYPQLKYSSLVWFAANIEICRQNLEWTGLLGKPKLIRKSSFIEQCRKEYELLKDPKLYLKPGVKITRKPDSLQEFISIWGEIIASNDCDFKNDCWVKYLKKWRAKHNHAGKNKNLNRLYLMPDGTAKKLNEGRLRKDLLQNYFGLDTCNH